MDLLGLASNESLFSILDLCQLGNNVLLVFVYLLLVMFHGYFLHHWRHRLVRSRV